MSDKDNLRHIKNLLEMVADDSATIELQAAQLEQYAKMLDDERATVSVLRAQLDAVPVKAIIAYTFNHYDDFSRDDQPQCDAAAIDAWLRSLEDAA